MPVSPEPAAAGAEAPADAARRLLQRLAALQARADADEGGPDPAPFEAALARARRGPRLAGRATAEGTRSFAGSFGRGTAGFYRPAGGLVVSSLGHGTNQGAADDETDLAYARAVHASLSGGINLVDTALNYRRQRAERAVGAGLRVFLEEDDAAREGVVLCTKGGFLVPGGFRPEDLDADEVADGVHCMAPAFLVDQIARSRRNLGVQTLDVYYLHNPELQLRAAGARAFRRRLVAAFETLERAACDGRIGAYGAATWEGLRSGALSLPEMVAAARDVAGDDHRFGFVQLPFNAGMQEAAAPRGPDGRSLLEVAADLGITVVASACLAHADRLTQPSARGAIQFARNTPGIACALVGMRRRSHVTENLAVARPSPAAA